MQRSRSVLLALVLLFAQWFVAFSELAHADLQCDAECMQSLAALDGEVPLLSTLPSWQPGSRRIEMPWVALRLHVGARRAVAPRARAPPLSFIDSRRV